jgi:hypothetical protein
MIFFPAVGLGVSLQRISSSASMPQRQDQKRPWSRSFCRTLKKMARPVSARRKVLEPRITAVSTSKKKVPTYKRPLFLANGGVVD